ncbi:unnamed protein product [Gordionus sp. m RMFG-2023]
MNSLEPKKNWNIDDFDIGGPLGRGKYGNAFLARERKSKLIVCLKMIFKKHIVLDGTEHQIIRELEIMRHLYHPNIIQYFGYFHDERRLFIILQYAPQGELYKLLKAANGFDDIKTASIISQVAAALKYCHSKKVIHRDIKPENILIMMCGQIKLADFGWSVHSPSLKRTTMCGTLDYICPEMVNSRAYNEKVDNWSLGILTFELLMAYPPFESDDRDETYRKIRKGLAIYPPKIGFLAKDFISKVSLTKKFLSLVTLIGKTMRVNE